MIWSVALLSCRANVSSKLSTYYAVHLVKGSNEVHREVIFPLVGNRGSKVMQKAIGTEVSGVFPVG